MVPLLLKKTEIKATMRYYLLLVRLAITEKNKDSKCYGRSELKEIFIYSRWKCKLAPLSRKRVWRLFNMLKIEVPYGSTLPLLIHSKERKSVCRRDMSKPMFSVPVLGTEAIKEPVYMFLPCWLAKEVVKFSLFGTVFHHKI